MLKKTVDCSLRDTNISFGLLLEYTIKKYIPWRGKQISASG
jgi:hypothetical protein